MSPGQADVSDHPPREVLASPGQFAQAARASTKADIWALPVDAGAPAQWGGAGSHTQAGQGVPHSWWGGRQVAEKPGAQSQQQRELG